MGSASGMFLFTNETPQIAHPRLCAELAMARVSDSGVSWRLSPLGVVTRTSLLLLFLGTLSFSKLVRTPVRQNNTARFVCVFGSNTFCAFQSCRLFLRKIL